MMCNLQLQLQFSTIVPPGTSHHIWLNAFPLIFRAICRLLTCFDNVISLSLSSFIHFIGHGHKQNRCGKMPSSGAVSSVALARARAAPREAPALERARAVRAAPALERYVHRFFNVDTYQLPSITTHFSPTNTHHQHFQPLLHNNHVNYQLQGKGGSR